MEHFMTRTMKLKAMQGQIFFQYLSLQFSKEVSAVKAWTYIKMSRVDMN